MARVKAPRRSSHSGNRAPWIIAAVVAFIIADIVLVAFAVSKTQASTTSTPPELLPSISSSATVRPSATPTPTAAPTTAKPASFLVATSATEGWRSTAGVCGVTLPVIESTTDAGVTWTPHSTGDLAVSEVLALTATSASAATIVGKTGAGCSIDTVATFTGGQFWQSYPERLVEQSFVDATSPGVLHLRGAELNAPCPVVLDLEVVSNRPAVLCENAAFQRSTTTTEWFTASTPGAQAFSVNASRMLLASRGVAGCAGIAIQTVTLPLTATSTPTAVGCAASVSLAGPVSLDAIGQSIWLSAGETTVISSDGGSTW